MLEHEWDVILIGAGQNSFALGTYLGKAGLRTVICESRLENGGRLATEELTIPGYWHNTLAYFQDNREISPVWKELDWEDGHHAEFTAPPVISSLLLRDGRSISHHQALDHTVASISRFSGADARAWRRTHDRFSKIIREHLIPHYYRAPENGGNPLGTLETDPSSKEFTRLSNMSAREVIDELFDDEIVKTLVLSPMAIPHGVADDYAGGGVEVLKLVAGEEKPEFARGGSHSIAQVLQRAYVHAGGQIRAVHHIERIIVDKGRAVGVRLRDGREWKAKLAVVSDADPYATFVEMIDQANLPKTFRERVKEILTDEFSYFQVHLALKAPVRYALHEAVDQSLAQAMNINIGPEKPEDIDAMWDEIRAGEFPRHACLHVICPTVFDPLQAPRGKHTASLYMPVPFELKNNQPEDWIELKNHFMDGVLKIWRQYATNLTDNNIEMKVAIDPYYLSQRWPNLRRGSVWGARKNAAQMGAKRPIAELAGYRTPIERLYQIGVATHPADAVIAGSGYNCWRVMKEDLKI